jgi:tetratricopeptide (TPR) repeat protein
VKIHDLPRPDFSKKSFLIIEDYESMRTILRNLLGRAGATHIDAASSGNNAVAMLERNRYDAVLCDLHLGQGKNGQQVLEEARLRRLVAPHTVWLMVSSEKTAEMVMGTVETRPDDYLVKPITETLLFTRLLRQMDKKKVLAPIEQAVRDHEYLKALRMLDQLIAIPNPYTWDMKRLKADLALLSGNLGLAREVFEEALSQRDLPWARLGLARILFQDGRLEEARQHLLHVTGGSRSYLEAHDWLARTLEGLGDLDGAQEALERALSVSPHVATRQSSLGQVAARRGDLETAERAYRRGIELGRSSPQASAEPYLSLARVFLARDESGEAAKVMGRLASDMKDDGNAQFLARVMEIPIRLKSGGEKVVRQLLAGLAPRLRDDAHLLPPELVFDLADPLMRLGEMETIHAMFSSLLANHHEHPDYADRVRTLYAEAGRADEGVKLVEEATRSAMDIMDKGVRLSREGKLDEAISLLREARQKIPGNPRLLLNHAYLLINYMEQRGRDLHLVNEALECIQSALRLRPHDKRAGELLGRLEQVEA